MRVIKYVAKYMKQKLSTADIFPGENICCEYVQHITKVPKFILTKCDNWFLIKCLINKNIKAFSLA